MNEEHKTPQAYKEPYEEEDVFTLESDEDDEKKRHVFQYSLIGGVSVLVIALAFVGAIWLTNARTANQSVASVPEATDAAAPLESTAPVVNEWPSDQFPAIPVFESSGYDTKIYGSRAEIAVPPLSVSGFDAYADSLAEDGANIFVRSKTLIVLSYKGVEVHLVASGSETSIILCGEDAADWDDSDYLAFPLPKEGKLVAVEDGVGARSKVLTYRNASSVDAQQYLSKLSAAGWTISGTLSPENQVFNAIYKKGTQQITVDYFSSSDNYQVKLAYLG